MVALSESVMKNRLKRPLLDKSRLRHIRLAIKPRYLGNHASQKKSCYRTLSGSHGRSFRIRQEKSPEAPPGGVVTSYPVGNKTSSRKPCIADKKLLWNAIRKSWLLLQNPSWKIAWNAPGCKITMTSYEACNKTSLFRKPCIPDKYLLWNAIGKSWSLFQNPSWKIAWSAPWRRTDDDAMSGWQYNIVISETKHRR